MESFVGRIHAPEFPADLDWLNCEAPLSLRGLRGKVILFEFWTFCCINCHHNIDQVRRLKELFGDALVVIGVHSAKFEAEKSTRAIRQAVLRHQIDYPVVNDHRFDIWRSYCVRAWPTLILVDPEGCLKAQHSGEIEADQLAPLIGRMIEHFDRRGILSREPLAARSEEPAEPVGTLRFPSKVLASMDGHLFVADTGHHRLLEIALDAERRRGRIRRVFGRGEPGLEDGAARQASFHSPHGIARWGSRLYVADTGNHAIRRIDLVGGEVRTLAGTGRKAPKLGLAGPPGATPLRSPWDICCHRHSQLFIAMAGSHQIYSLTTGEALLPGDEPPPPELAVFAGTGAEALIDDQRLRASFNQPSGLAANRNQLFVADAEASAIRRVPVAGEPSGESRVETLIGTGLFDFGDTDGTGLEVLLQHPTGIALFDGWLYIADTFNHKIKRLDPATRETRSLFGNGQCGCQDGSFDEAMLAEPEGLSFEPGRRRIYVADTSNHRIRVADLDTRCIWSLEIEA